MSAAEHNAFPRGRYTVPEDPISDGGRQEPSAGPDAALPAQRPGGQGGAVIQCCERDYNRDGNCDRHSAPGVLRKRQSKNLTV